MAKAKQSTGTIRRSSTPAEDGTARDADDIPTIGQSKRDGIQNPQHIRLGSQQAVVAGDPAARRLLAALVERAHG
jgi:hypothetical protein